MDGAQLDATLQELLQCVQLHLDPAPCQACVVAGPPALDACCDQDGCSGQLTVHLLSLVPVDGQLRRAAPTVTPCRPGLLAADVRVTVARCHPTLDASGAAPDCQTLDAAAAQLSADVAAIQLALACCGPRTAVASVDVTAPPQGGCIVAVGSALVELGD